MLEEYPRELGEQSQTHIISFEYLNDTRPSLKRLTGPSQCRRNEIIKPKDPRENCPKMIKAKYADT